MLLTLVTSVALIHFEWPLVGSCVLLAWYLMALLTFLINRPSVNIVLIGVRLFIRFVIPLFSTVWVVVLSVLD